MLEREKRAYTRYVTVVSWKLLDNAKVEYSIDMQNKDEKKQNKSVHNDRFHDRSIHIVVSSGFNRNTKDFIYFGDLRIIQLIFTMIHHFTEYLHT